MRKTANGPLLRLDFDLTSGRYTYDSSPRHHQRPAAAQW
ncbi:hypothetical protein MJL30_39660 [Salmonella enterica subsp. enterica serovar Anatum]|nr:hypothetical protein [Salmonella enterica subsp. enterica serovar Anatum]